MEFSGSRWGGVYRWLWPSFGASTSERMGKEQRESWMALQALQPLNPPGAQEVFPVMQKGPGLYTHPNSVVGCSWSLELLGTALCNWGGPLPMSQEPETAPSSEGGSGEHSSGCVGPCAGWIYRLLWSVDHSIQGFSWVPPRKTAEQRMLQLEEACSLLVRPSLPLFSDEDSPVRGWDLPKPNPWAGIRSQWNRRLAF